MKVEGRGRYRGGRGEGRGKGALPRREKVSEGRGMREMRGEWEGWRSTPSGRKVKGNEEKRRGRMGGDK